MKTLLELQEELDGYAFLHDDPLPIARNVIRGEIRQMAVAELLLKKYLPCRKVFRFFINRTQGSPMIEQLKLKGFLIEKAGFFLVNPSWIKNPDNASVYTKVDKK